MLSLLNLSLFLFDKYSFEYSLPKYLKDDIEALIIGRETNSTVLDCLWCEVYGSINSALYSYEITDQEAKYLRYKYLGI